MSSILDNIHKEVSFKYDLGDTVKIDKKGNNYIISEQLWDKSTDRPYYKLTPTHSSIKEVLTHYYEYEQFLYPVHYRYR